MDAIKNSIFSMLISIELHSLGGERDSPPTAFICYDFVAVLSLSQASRFTQAAPSDSATHENESRLCVGSHTDNVSGQPVSGPCACDSVKARLLSAIVETLWI
jgi:hypothetical protein